MRRFTPLLALFLAAAPLLESCTQEGSAAAPKTDLELLRGSLGDVERIHVLGQVYLATQPSEVAFQAAADAGYRTVLDLRMAEEDRGFTEADHVRALDMEYVHLPFRTPESLTDEVFDRARELMRDEASHPLIVHCASANRVGAVWLVHRVMDDGIGWEDALDEAEAVGLSSSGYEAKARNYVERRR